MSLPSVSQIQLGAVTLDLVRGRVVPESGDPLELSTRESELLRYLAERPGRVVSRDEIYLEVWGYSARVVSRALDSTLSRLRATLEKAGASGHLHTVRGQGYAYVPVGLKSLACSGREPGEFLLHLQRGARLITLLGPPASLESGVLLDCLACLPPEMELRWVHLGDCQSENELRQRVLGAYGESGLEKPPLGDALLEQLLEGPEEHWLILSGVGHLLDATARLAVKWMGAVPGLRMVLTSDSPLEIAGEHLARP